MSKHNHLPIYNIAFGLLKELYTRVPKLNKQYKYTLGASLISVNTECLKLIIKANNLPIKERKEVLVELYYKIGELESKNLIPKQKSLFYGNSNG